MYPTVSRRNLRHSALTSRAFGLSLGFLLGAYTISTHAITIELDYSYDVGGFFNPARKALMDSAASYFQNQISDTLSAITPSVSDHWTVSFYDPSTGSQTTVANPTIASDTLRVYVGARSMVGGTLGVGGFGGVASGSGSGAFINSINTRGQTGATASSLTSTDFAPWGGSISFNSSATWYFDSDPSTKESFVGQNDFYSVALHELGHLLGIGTAPSFMHDVNGSHQFTGANAVASYGGNVPLESDDGHFQEGTTSVLPGTATSQEVALDPTITVGTRKEMTELDLATLKDIGWQVASVPEPAEAVLFGLGALACVAMMRQKSAPN